MNSSLIRRGVKFAFILGLVMLISWADFSLCRAEAEVSEAAILAVINKRHSELHSSTQMQLLGPVYLASLLDPVPYQVAGELQLKRFSPEKRVTLLSNWIAANMAHTQALSQFDELPGNDVWGAVDGSPIYKAGTPSEMLAMRALTGKVTEKCTGLAFFNAALFTIAGVEPENMVFLRMSNHTVALMKYNQHFYFLDNLKVIQVTDDVQSKYATKSFNGLYNGLFSMRQSFVMDEPDFYNLAYSVMGIFETLKSFDLASARYDGVLPRYFSRKQLVKEIFGKTLFSESEVGTLTRYAYCSLNVAHPEMYLKAALRMPLVTDLAATLTTTEDIFNWVGSNLEEGSIFTGEPDRIMPAEDVVLFKKGSPMDRALLTWALLKLKGNEPVLVIGAKSAYIELDNQIYDIKGFKPIQSIKEGVRLRLRI